MGDEKLKSADPVWGGVFEPNRSKLERAAQADLGIGDAMLQVEKLGVDATLIDISVGLAGARDLLKQWVNGEDKHAPEMTLDQFLETLPEDKRVLSWRDPKEQARTYVLAHPPLEVRFEDVRFIAVKRGDLDHYSGQPLSDTHYVVHVDAATGCWACARVVFNPQCDYVSWVSRPGAPPMAF